MVRGANGRVVLPNLHTIHAFPILCLNNMSALLYFGPWLWSLVLLVGGGGYPFVCSFLYLIKKF